MDARTIKTYVDMYAMSRPSPIADQYEALREDKRVPELRVMAAVLIGWLACAQFMQDTAATVDPGKID